METIGIYWLLNDTIVKFKGIKKDKEGLGVPKLRLPFMGRGGEVKGSGAGARRVLVVEDEPSICQVCLRTLTDEGFEVDIAANGASAQNMLEEKEYALCLIDIRTPVLNGQQLYQWVSEQHPEMVKRLVFTTGDLMGGDTESFLERTGRPFLAKPFTLDELKAMVSETLRQIER
jgi:DNA-binding response OmpR family regulator